MKKKRKPILDHFGFLAPHYDSLAQPREPEKLMSLAHLPADGIVLDAGGGTGRVAQYLRRKVSQVIVADASFKMLREAKKKEGLQTVLSFTETLPFQNDTFDCIIMVDALHHVADQLKTSEELWRILKPGGRLIIEEPDIRILGVKFIALVEKLALMRSHILSPRQMIHLFQGKPSLVRVETQKPIVWVVIEK